MWQLIELAENQQQKIFTINQTTIIGSHENADIVLSNQHISEYQVRLFLQEDQLWIDDLNPISKTQVNHQYITEPQQLHDQDIIQINHIQWTVVYSKDTLDNKVTEQQLILEQGMPTLQERAGHVQLNQGGMPINMAIPKPAPIPDDVQLNTEMDPKPIAITPAETVAEKMDKQAENIKIGLISLIVLFVIIVGIGIILR